VETLFDKEAVLQRSPKSQVIRPGQVAGFNVIFQSNIEVNLAQSFKYRVNRIHLFGLTVSAHLGPIEPELSRQIIDFRCVIDSPEASDHEILVSRNSSTSRAEFSWAGFSGAIFRINIESSWINPSGSWAPEIRYLPRPVSHSEYEHSLERYHH
jgi:hypothetical protein